MKATNEAELLRKAAIKLRASTARFSGPKTGLLKQLQIQIPHVVAWVNFFSQLLK
jgi:hypothetical protein